MFKKKVGHRQYRKKDDSESDNETQTAINPEEREVLQEALELRRYRKRPQGVTAQELLAGDVKSIAKPKEAPDDDPWKLKSGGLIDMTEMKTRGNFQMDSSAGGSGFAAASNVMDTEKKMQEFIEAELRKRKSEAGGPGGNGDHGEEKDVAPDDELFVIPDHLQVSSKPVSEGNVTLSAAMLTAIPEVDLGITSKLKNIEETEKAKRDMILMKNSKEPENAEARSFDCCCYHKLTLLTPVC
ncbi:hepatocellular carcinoma-associated antigen 59-domain-containing protein [Chytridium lagenaria]|nr:hepatocellular carcinoma-associated antigen 59-domain-containing protein [Chytridium lagenaria]